MSGDLSPDEARFVKRLMRELQVPAVEVERAGTGDIRVLIGGPTPKITVGEKWAAVSPDERKKRLLHEFLHIGGLRHDAASRKAGYFSRPERDRLSQAVYERFTQGNPIATHVTSKSAAKAAKAGGFDLTRFGRGLGVSQDLTEPAGLFLSPDKTPKGLKKEIKAWGFDTALSVEYPEGNVWKPSAKQEEAKTLEYLREFIGWYYGLSPKQATEALRTNAGKKAKYAAIVAELNDRLSPAAMTFRKFYAKRLTDEGYVAVENKDTVHGEKQVILLDPSQAKVLGSRLLNPSRSPVIGKDIGGALYVHRAYESVLPQSALQAAKAGLPADWDYQIVKYDRKSGAFTFTQSPDWDTADEPMVGDAMLVKPDGTTRKLTAASDPWIYHHKWMFVGPDFTGFDVEQSKQRSAQWGALPGLDRSRIGKLSYWQREVLPRLPNPTQEEIEVANRTARALGAIGGKAIVPRYVAETSTSGESVLDFGSGPAIAHTLALREQGLDVTAHEFGSNVRPGVHDADALSRRYDTVFASNVLNVQSSDSMLDKTLDDLTQAVAEGGRLVVNLPESPRKMDIDARRLEDKLRSRFERVRRVGGTKHAPLFDATGPLRNPAPKLSLARRMAKALGLKRGEVRMPEFAKGLEAELEHRDVTGGDPMLTAKIALAHLRELPDYYTRLAKMERKRNPKRAGVSPSIEPGNTVVVSAPTDRPGPFPFFPLVGTALKEYGGGFLIEHGAAMPLWYPYERVSRVRGRRHRNPWSHIFTGVRPYKTVDEALDHAGEGDIVDRWEADGWAVGNAGDIRYERAHSQKRGYFETQEDALRAAERKPGLRVHYFGDQGEYPYYVGSKDEIALEKQRQRKTIQGTRAFLRSLTRPRARSRAVLAADRNPGALVRIMSKGR